MRFVVKPEAHKTDKLTSKDTYNALLNIATLVDKSRITDAIYREPYGSPDEKRSKVEDHLALSYLNKCAYCERLCKSDIEHYRPKKKVNEDGNHEGYYWLCYEWTNLLPACVKCNRDGAKHNKFPIKGNRVYAPSFLPNKDLNLDHNKAQNNPLLSEDPLLLHPEIDNPEKYFDFVIDPDGEGIRISGIDANGRGNATIEICLLNRQELKIERQRNVILSFKKPILAAFGKRIGGSFSEDQLIDMIQFQIGILIDNANDESYSHTLLRKFIVKNEINFASLVLPFLPYEIRRIVFTAFKNFIK